MVDAGHPVDVMAIEAEIDATMDRDTDAAMEGTRLDGTQAAGVVDDKASAEGRINDDGPKPAVELRVGKTNGTGGKTRKAKAANRPLLATRPSLRC